MSASANSGSEGLPEHSQDRESWDELGNPEQQDTLVEAMQERALDGSGDADVPDWDDYDEPTKSETLAAIEQSLEDTWTVEAFEGVENKRTIPVEVYELTGDQEEEMNEKAEVISRVSQLSESDDIDDVDDLREEMGEDADELFESLEDAETWLFEFLGEISEDPTLSADWWRDTSNYPAGLHSEVFSEIFVRHQEQQQAAQSFREKRLGGRSR
ncbi:hypothetical protein [Halococcus sp. AFM35]|uniref:hypothetical protein n=1 Tax=Halococcus sp. AFM35 TaxID=3421653 RepID=UPI003EBD3E71